MADDAAELAVAYVSLLPSLQGFTAPVERALGNLGVGLGRDFGKDFARAAVQGSGPDIKRLAAQVEAAHSVQADAAGKARIAEARLAEARKKTGDTSARTIAAEEALAKATRELATAQSKSERAAEAHAAAEKDLGNAAETADKKVGPFGRAIRRVKAEVDDTSKALRDSKSSLRDSFLGSLGGNLVAAGIGGAIEGLGRLRSGAVDFFKESAAAASDLNEAGTATEAIFGKKGADALAKFAENGAKIGQTATGVLDAAATFGTFGKAAGLSGDKLSTFSSDFVTLSSDLASFKNTSPEDAVEAIGSALRGESEPLRRYGVLLDDATLKAEAMRIGLFKSTKDQGKIAAAQTRLTIAQRTYNAAVKEHGKDSIEAKKAALGVSAAQDTLKKATSGVTANLTPQQKVLAAQAAIYRQTKDAQGDFARTSGGLANSQRILAAETETVKREFGQLLLPLFQKGVVLIGQKFLPVFKNLIQGYKDSTGPGGQVRKVVEGISAAAQAAAPYVKDLGGYVKTGFGGVADAVGGLINTGTDIKSWVEDNKGLVEGLAISIGVLLLPALVGAGATATASAATQVAAWATTRTASIVSSATQFASSYKVLAGWVASGAAAVASGAQTAYVWALYKVESVKAAGVFVAQQARIAASWVASGAAAGAAAVRTGAVWVAMRVQALASAGVIVAQHVAMVVRGWAASAAAAVAAGARTALVWVVMGAQATAGAAMMIAAKVREAAAWTVTTGVMLAASAASKVVAAGQWLLNAALSANPIGLVVVAIAAFVGALIYAYKHSETFRKIVNTAFYAIKTAAGIVFGWLKTAVVAVIKFVTAYWSGLTKAFKHPIQTAKDAIAIILGKTGLQKVFTNAVNAIGSIWGKLQGLAKKPIKFIVETVLENGLLAAFRYVSDKVGYDAGKNLHIGLPKGFKTGGVLPGYTPGRDVHRFISPTGGVLDLSGGEPIMRPEFGRVVGHDWVDQANAAARSGGVGGVKRFLGGGYQAHKSGGYYRPVKGGGISQGLHDQYTGFPSIDFSVPVGTPVEAVAGGRVSRSQDIRGAGNGGYASYGRVIQIMHAGFETLYAHLSRRGVGVGKQVKAGQLIGLSGNTGHSTGPHLHFGAKGISPYTFVGGKSSFAGSLGAGIASGAADLFDALGALKDRFAGPIKRLQEAGSSPIAMMARGAAVQLKDALIDKAKSFAGAVGDVATGGSNRARGLALMTAAGFGPSQWGPLNKLWTKESGWRTNATNPSSGAYGIPQSLPGSKMASVGADWRTNPNTQIRWGLKYIKSVYGNPAKAWAHSQRTNWYASGTMNARAGLAWVGENGPELVDFGGGEKVYNQQMLTQNGDSDESMHVEFSGQVGADAREVVAMLHSSTRKAKARRRYRALTA